MKTGENKSGKLNMAFHWLPCLILFLYSLRHINWGLDLQDTGYNYANFLYMGQDHMDSMWLFATYLANAVGNFLTKLPLGHTLVGMNFYTGLFTGALAIGGYWFCVKKLQIPAWIAFLGEMLAVSLGWCPTALLYNYLTYVLLLACLILLYVGLSRHKLFMLFLAGACLGTNLLVRFSNLPEAALIVGVWAYAVIQGLEERKKGGKFLEKTWGLAWRYTLWCLGGYLAALAVFFCYIHFRYGMGEYVTGVLRLFDMTETATDYKATSMIMGIVGTYVENLYWVVRIGVILAGGVVLFALTDFVSSRTSLRTAVFQGKIVRILWIGVSVTMVVWLYFRQFCSFYFYSYDSMLRPGILFLMLTLGICVLRIFYPNVSKEEQLISGLVFLVVLITSIGSNNGVYPSLNNLFVAAPYTLWQCWRFFRNVGEWRGKHLVLSAYPAKGLLAAFLAMVLFQCVSFGACFVFQEATGARQVTAKVEGNEVLRGVHMHPDRADWMQEISDYVEEQNLIGREVILYGGIPALSFYLEMPSAFNPWSDLDSYSLETMTADMTELEREMEASGEYPVVILENRYVEYMEKGVEALEAMNLPEDRIRKMENDGKWKLILGFLDRHAYSKTFSNEKFSVFEQ